MGAGINLMLLYSEMGARRIPGVPRPDSLACTAMNKVPYLKKSKPRTKTRGCPDFLKCTASSECLHRTLKPDINAHTSDTRRYTREVLKVH